MPQFRKLVRCFGRIENLEVFLQNDVKTGFHRIRMKSEDTDEKPFTKFYGQLECRIMQIEAWNILTTYQTLGHDVFHDRMAEKFMVYSDNLFDFSKKDEI